MVSDPHKRWRWKDPVNGVSAMARNYNPLCQWVSKDTGQQCTKPSEVVHHIVDWKDDASRFFDWANIVCTCEDHHQGGQRGETQGYLYVHTIGPLDSVYPQSARMFPCWHRDFKSRPSSVTEPGFLPPGSTASSVGDELLDRALREPL